MVGHGSLGSTETLRAQRAYLADMQAQVRAGIKAGKAADQLAKEIDLSKHGQWAADQMQTRSAIRQVFRKAY